MRILFTTWEAGGHVPAALLVAAELQRRGEAVLFVSDEATRPAAVQAGLRFEPWRTAPNRAIASAADDPLNDWRAATPIGVVKRVCDAVMCRPALAYARDTLEIVEAFAPDVIVTQELLFGVMAAAELSRRKLVLLTGNLWCFPTRGDLPPFGPGFAPSRRPKDLQRDRITRGMIARLYDLGRAGPERRSDIDRSGAAASHPRSARRSQLDPDRQRPDVRRRRRSAARTRSPMRAR